MCKSGKYLMVEMGEMVTCDGIKARVGKLTMNVHPYEGNIFFIHVFNLVISIVVTISFRWFLVIFCQNKNINLIGSSIPWPRFQPNTHPTLLHIAISVKLWYIFIYYILKWMKPHNYLKCDTCDEPRTTIMWKTIFYGKMIL